MNKTFRILILLLFPVGLYGQLAPVTNHYILNPLMINPAFAGDRGVLNLATFYRKQWVGVTGSPETITFSADAPVLEQKLGLGLIIVSDKVGATRENQFNTNYAYRIDVGSGFLCLGLGAGVITTNTAFSSLIVLDPGDEIFLADSRLFVVPNFSFGVQYSNRNFFSAFSIPRFLSYKFDFDKGRYALNNEMRNYSYRLNAGNIFDISPRLRIFPSVLLQYSLISKLQYDINAVFSIFDKLWLGASWLNNRSVAGLIQFQPNNQIRIAYTYDFDFNKLGRYSNGSHEVMLRYQFRYKVNVLNPLAF